MKLFTKVIIIARCVVYIKKHVTMLGLQKALHVWYIKVVDIRRIFRPPTLLLGYCIVEVLQSS